MNKVHGMTGKANARQGGENKKTKIQIRCTHEQKEMIAEASKKQGKTISNYLLDLAEKENQI